MVSPSLGQTLRSRGARGTTRPHICFGASLPSAEGQRGLRLRAVPGALHRPQQVPDGAFQGARDTCGTPARPSPRAGGELQTRGTAFRTRSRPSTASRLVGKGSNPRRISARPALGRCHRCPRKTEPTRQRRRCGGHRLLLTSDLHQSSPGARLRSNPNAKRPLCLWGDQAARAIAPERRRAGRREVRTL